MATQDQAQQSTSTPATSTLNLNSIMIGTDQFQALVDFYGRVFGRPADMTDSGYAGWQVGSCFLSIGEHSEIHGKAKEPARVILNLETGDVRGEFARLKGLGVAVVKEPYEMGDNYWIATLADPDGNYLQLMMPWEGEMGG